MDKNNSRKHKLLHNNIITVTVTELLVDFFSPQVLFYSIVYIFYLKLVFCAIPQNDKKAILGNVH